MTLRNRLPVNALRPPTNAPKMQVIKTSMNEDAPNPMIALTLGAKMFALYELIASVRMSHRRNNPTKPARNAASGLCGIAMATINAATAMLHQGRYRASAKASIAERSVEMANFMTRLPVWFIKLEGTTNSSVVAFSFLHYP